MSYTQEQLAKMSDREVGKAIAALFGYKVVWGSTDYSDGSGWVTELNGDYHSREFLMRYCTDWSATGPLMVEYGVIIIYNSEGKYQFVESSRDCEVFSINPNPLRAVCEVILMMEGA